MKIQWRIEGASKLHANLMEMSAVLRRRAMREGLIAGAVPVQNAMQGYAPRGDPAAPNMADSIGISPSPRPGGMSVAVGPTQDIEYARHQEHGTIHHAAHPFARPAMDSAKSSVWPIVSRVVWRALAERSVSSVRGDTGSGVGL